MDNMNTKCVRTPASIQQVMSPIWKHWCIGDLAESAPGHPSGGAHQQLPRDRGQRQADGAAAAGATAAGPGGTDPEGTELPEGENSERFFFCMTAVLPRCSVQTLFMTCFFFSCVQQYREERFRMTSESTNQRVLWWSIAQTLILIVTGIWQMKHLKSFFEAKKLV